MTDPESAEAVRAEDVRACGPGVPDSPACIVHGPMKFRFAGDWWVCPGWDGEGCCAVTAEQAEGNRGVYARVRPVGEPSVHGFRVAIPA